MTKRTIKACLDDLEFIAYQTRYTPQFCSKSIDRIESALRKELKKLRKADKGK